MLSNKIIAVLAASSAVAVFSAAAANADPIVKQEQNQLGDTAAPNVPEPSMKGGQSIPTEEKKQLGN